MFRLRHKYILKMVSGVLCSSVVERHCLNIVERHLSLKPKSAISAKITRVSVQGENEIETFDSFSERALSYLQSRIDVVTRGL